MQHAPRPSRFNRGLSRTGVLVILPTICVVGYVILSLGPHKVSYVAMSARHMKQLAFVIHVYATDFGAWPTALDATVLEYAGLEAERLLENPREGYVSYAYEEPPFVWGDPDAPASTTPMLFEVCEHGATVRNAGIIGYADGRVETRPDPATSR